MRKLKLQVQMSVDGFIAGPNGEMDWMVWDWDDKIKTYVNDLTDSIDTILLDRKMAGSFISHWTGVTGDANNPNVEFSKKMIDTPKIVFSRTLSGSEPATAQWKNTIITKGKLTEEVQKLKNKNGKDIIVYVGATFDSALVKAGLVDEFYLFINPATIGVGLSIFSDINNKVNMELEQAIPFDCGIVLLKYLRGHKANSF